MTFDEFYAKYNGKLVDVDGVAGVQCCDLVKAGMKDMYSIPYFSFGGSAKNLWEDFNQIPQLYRNFERIPNTPEFVPKKSDICVWNGNVGGGHGHCSWGMGEGNTKEFFSFDQNWSGKSAHKQRHNYKNFYGVLRHKNSKGNDKTPVTEKTAYFPKYEGVSTSIVDCLLRVKAGTSFAYRKEIAKANGIDKYTGTMEQNAKLVELLKKGKLIKP